MNVLKLLRLWGLHKILTLQSIFSLFYNSFSFNFVHSLRWTMPLGTAQALLHDNTIYLSVLSREHEHPGISTPGYYFNLNDDDAETSPAGNLSTFSQTI